jgi:dolichol-phosphate mannosyltransferase
VFLAVLGIAQTILAARIVFRMIRTAGGLRITRSREPAAERITILLPVLNEVERIETCLDRLITQPPEVREILVIDGGSSDGTQGLVNNYQIRDHRIKLLDASPVDDHWTGKAWGLQFGLQRSNPECQWILCVDADVSVSEDLARSLLAHGRRTGVSTFSVAAQQQLSGTIDALIHPALLTTLVYRFGLPGKHSGNRHQVQANGQCFIARRETLLNTQAFVVARTSLCEDITTARHLADAGEIIGFYETDDLVETRMYKSWGETWANWPRSLAIRDRYFSWRELLGLLEVLLVQGLPLPLLLLSRISPIKRRLIVLNATLLLMRLGVLHGTARAYRYRPWSYWLSFVFDPAVALRLWQSALLRRQVWRGRAYIRRGSTFEPIR